jgi:hypothetical protein
MNGNYLAHFRASYMYLSLWQSLSPSPLRKSFRPHHNCEMMGTLIMGGIFQVLQSVRFKVFRCDTSIEVEVQILVTNYNVKNIRLSKVTENISTSFLA